jgi:hypothetical protein
MANLVFDKQYILPKKNYSYTISAYEVLKNVKEETATSDACEDDTSSGVPQGLLPFFASYAASYKPQESPKKSEPTNVVSLGKEFVIMAISGFQVALKVLNKNVELGKFLVEVEKLEKRTNKKDSFVCFMDLDLVNGIVHSID